MNIEMATTSNAHTHAIVAYLAVTSAESPAGGVKQVAITVLVTLPVDDCTRLVRTLVVSHVILTIPVFLVVGLVRYVADTANARRPAAIRAPLVQRNVDGTAVTGAILAVCHARSPAISFLATVVAKRSWRLVGINVQGFVGSSVQTRRFAGPAARSISLRELSTLPCLKSTERSTLTKHH
jgi:hypothetical protein